ncbi:SET and MYND domain-containing protein 4-like [Galleria mellonella]|uniref:Protein-lysine N-methyltransferase SMYD4 n=1 Tax=Galleria mellonella TaxID=7137 RepID=A0ABM3MJ94_GALME|nr:SET and MYND domain-containing protein 4-like [Galleria mellonella]
MNNISLPEDCAKQWEILLLLLSAEEKKIDRTSDNEVDTMNYFYKNEGVRKILLQWLHQMQMSYAKKMSESDTALKCDEVSLLWRQRGNDKFRADCYQESYRCYSKSVLYAHQNKAMYPLALANRSASLLKMKKFKDCLADVALALDSGYPKELRHKLLLRRADCHIELNQCKEARVAIAAATDHAATLNLSSVHAAEFERHIKKLEEKLDVTRDVQAEEAVVLPECHHGLNPDFTAASNAIQLRRNDTVGRHVVTREATRRGDVLFSEEPYAWVALPAQRPVCEACCRIDINTVPCGGCSRSVYCGVECRTRAVGFHRWECVGAQAELFKTIGIAHLALRVLLITANEGFPPVPRTEPAPSTASELFRSYSRVDNIHIYKSGTHPFYRMFNLVTNFEKMNNTDYIQYALTATMLTLYLEKYTTFFEYLPSRVPYGLPDGQLQLLAAAIILRSLGQLVCNGHAALSLATVEEEDDSNGCTVSEREVRRATAIYPSAAMMNHSCDPNIINTFYNSRLIIRCSRELPAGSEVLNCYGPHRAREPTAHRRAQLRAQYMFSCTCTACIDTERRDFVLLFTAYACQSCKGPVVWSGRRAHCQQCNAEFHLERALAAIEHADELLAQAERCTSVEQRCERTQAAFKLKQQVWHRHHVSLRAAADTLARLYADTGEFSKSVELIKHNIQSLEYQFGSFSVEVAHELRKLSEVMLERIVRSPQNPDYRDWCLEAHKIMKKAVQLMELNYGSWEPLVKRLKEQESLTAALLADIRTPDAAQGVHHDLHYNLKI